MKKKFVKITAVSAIAALLVTGAVRINNNNSLNTVLASSNVITDETKEEVSKVWESTLNGVFAKDETVYAFCDAYGTSNSVIVSDWLLNGEGTKQLSDVSDLMDIVNVKGNEEFVAGDNNSVTWNTTGNDIYYQGTTTKELPVSVSATYYLDGEEISAEDLLHKSGKVTIRYEYTNTEKEQVTKDGETYEVYVPFLMATGVILPTDQFRNVEVSQGKVFSDGTRNIVLGYAIPGLEESLDLSDDSELSSYLSNVVEITADVEDFSLGMTLTVATSDFLSDFNVDELENIDSIDELITQVSDASEQLVEGSGTLAEGLETLQSKCSELGSAVSTLASAGSELASGAESLDSNMQTLVDGLAGSETGISTIVSGYEGDSGAISGANTIASGLAQLSAGTDALNTGVSSMVTTMEETIETYTSQVKELKTAQAKLVAAGSDLTSEQYEQLGQLEGAIAAMNQILAQMDDAKLSESVSTLSTATAKLKTGSEQLSTGLTKLYEGSKTLQTAITKLSSGSVTLKDGTKTLAAATLQLKSGTSQLNSSVSQLVEGVGTLADGSNELKEGMETFHEDVILKVIDSFNGDIKGLMNRLDATVTAGKEYNTFTQISDDCEGSVKFIIKTSEIE